MVSSTVGGSTSDRLEPPLQGGVLLQVLAVLIQRRGADAVEFAARQHRLEHVAGVDGPLGLARADDGVEFVDEEDDAALGLLDLLEDGLQAFLELAAVLRPGHQRAHVEGEEGLVLQPLGHVAADDPLRQALDDGGLAHARLADEDGVVLGLAREDADDPADFGIAPDDRVQAAGPGLAYEVAAVLLEGLVRALGRGAGNPLAAAHLREGLEEPVARHAELAEDPCRRGLRAFVQHRQDEVLDRDVLILHLAGRILGLDQQFAQPLREVDLAGLGPRSAYLRPAFEFSFHGRRKRANRHIHLVEEAGQQALFLRQERRQQVLDVHHLVPVPHGQRLGLVQGLLGFLGQSVEVHRGVSPGCQNRRRAGDG